MRITAFRPSRFDNILDCLPDEYYDIQGCLPRLSEGDKCSQMKNQCAQGLGCSLSNTCEKLCIVGDNKFGCPAGRKCVPMKSIDPFSSSSTNLGVCEEPEDFVRLDNPAFMIPCVFAIFFLFILIGVILRKKQGTNIIVTRPAPQATPPPAPSVQPIYITTPAPTPVQPIFISQPAPAPQPVFVPSPSPVHSPPSSVSTTTYYYSPPPPQTTNNYYYR
jgi:hypothetical protein